jgi:16S rRNA (guanine527-N7)-methyltransferase
MDASETRTRLNAFLTAAGLARLDDEADRRFESYRSLFFRWRRRLNLSGIRDDDEEHILSRHVVECIAVARDMPPAIMTLLDFGSGAGLPGIPIALCRPEIAVTLAESQGKKAAFLQEAVRVLGIKAKVHAGRAEALGAVFDCVILRAVDKMPKAVAAAVALVAPGGWLALMTTRADIASLRTAAGTQILWVDPVKLPVGNHRILALGRRISSAT